jgi:hypothetical protein
LLWDDLKNEFLMKHHTVFGSRNLAYWLVAVRQSAIFKIINSVDTSYCKSEWFVSIRNYVIILNYSVKELAAVQINFAPYHFITSIHHF